MSENYQKYVIENGTFVGKFEEMYRSVEDPWIQSNMDLSLARQATVLSLKRYGCKSIIELGCGLGYFTNMISKSTGSEIVGVDISETAISKASRMFTDLTFVTGDIFQGKDTFPNADCIIFAEITWYVLPKLKDFFEFLLKNYPNKYFMHNLVFYKGDTQKYGVEFFRNLDEFLDFCPLKLVEKTCRIPSESSEVVETHCVFQIVQK